MNIKKIVVRVSISILLISTLSAGLHFVTRFIPSEATLLSATHVDMTGDFVHILVKGEVNKFGYGKQWVEDRENYLLDFSVTSGEMHLYGPLSDPKVYHDLAINIDHQLVMGPDKKNNEINCYFRIMDFAENNYQWSSKQECLEDKTATGLGSMTPLEISGNLHRVDIRSIKPGSYGETLIYETISEELKFQRPSVDGGYYRVIDNNGHVIAEQKSPTEAETEQYLQVGVPFEFNKDAPLRQIHFSELSKALGLLPEGDLLLAFDFTWAAKQSIVLVQWDLARNKSKILSRIYYTDLFSISHFDYNLLNWWEKLKYFPLERRHPIVKVQKIAF